jgi:peptidyl-prolyl cis-trans isomerase D
MLQLFRGGNKRTKTIWWLLTILVVPTFVGGFIVGIQGGLTSGGRARATGAIGTVDGQSISRTEWQNALTEQRESFRRTYGSDPGDRDLKMVEIQTWRSLVAQRLLDKKAKQLGLAAHDHEVVVALQTNPPQAVMMEPSFQTDGKFDQQKYRTALSNPNNVAVVAGLEEMTRQQLPMRKLQERLIVSVKLAEPELRDGFKSRFETVNATVVHVPPADGQPPAPTDAQLQSVYDRHKTRFFYGPRSQLEALVVPKQLSDEEVRSAQSMAQSLVDRARRGESFASLARDHSEGPSADQGGVIDRVLQPQDFGTDLAAQIAVLDTGAVTDPQRDRGRFLIFKLLERANDPQTGAPGVKVAQIVIRIRGNPETLRQQYLDLEKVRKQASKIGLGKAAASRGMATLNTGYFDASTTPQILYGAPEAADWGLGAKTGAVSPVFEGVDEFVIVQVAAAAPAGPAPREEIIEPLRQIAQTEARVAMNKAKADAIAQAIAGGASLEQAAAAAGVAAFKVEAMSRAQPDQRLMGAPEVIGALFGAPLGKVVGPIQPVNGYYFFRVEHRNPADMALFEQIKGQISSEMLRARQQNFIGSYMQQMRTQAKVEDLRNEGTPY